MYLLSINKFAKIFFLYILVSFGISSLRQKSKSPVNVELSTMGKLSKGLFLKNCPMQKKTSLLPKISYSST